MLRLFQLILVILLISCSNSTSTKTIALADALPPKSILVFEFETVKQLQTDLSTNSFIKQNLDNKLIIDLQQQLQLLSHVNSGLGGMLSISSIGSDSFAYTFITNSTETLVKTGLINNQKSLKYDGTNLNEISIDNDSFYSTQLNNIKLISSSRLTLENIIRSHNNNIKLEASFYKALKASSNSQHSLFVNLTRLPQLHQHLFKSSASVYGELGEWAVLDLEINTEDIMANGVILPSDGQQVLIEVLGDELNNSTKFAEAIPLNSTYFYNFSISDFKSFQDRRRNLGYTSEIISHPIEDFPADLSVTYTNTSICIDYMPKDVLGFEEQFLNDLKPNEGFRGEQIYELDKFDAFTHFSPLIKNFTPKFVTKFKGHFLFSKDLETLENTLVNIKNNATLAETDYFKDSRDQLKSSYTLQLGSLNENLLPHLASISQEHPNAWKQLQPKGFNLSLIQLDLQDQYTLVNAYSQSAVNSSKTSLKVNRLKQQHNLAMPPQYFVNWRTQQHDIVYQDQANVLHLIDSKGREIWQKQLDSKIVGKIKSLDIYKNTRLQLAFTTQNKLYVLDKNGNEVSRFPISFKQPITKGLQLFDYSNNGRHRFVVTQGSQIKIYNKDAKLVKGFEFKVPKSNITQAPKHIRIDSKDYILAQTENQLFILDRTGDIRVKPNQKFVPSNNAFYKFGNQFIGTSNNSELVTIETDGKVNLSPQNWFSNHYFTANKQHYVSLSENKLQINTEEVQLDYGLYLRPKLHEMRNTVFISVVDEQSQQLYLLNSEGELIDGFPIYATSEIELRELAPNQYEFITQGDEQSILVYQFSD
ncbi:hypothetical protein SAMN05444278_10913 [Psychroflexus salarius]|uniref:Uncharacterized protein n=1 Tax=Psychroflexus salarius TaxID=1155689 RepID=A0A1M4XH16_9FLAO|nr:hypothetical protein [Psychroflexus salarius]SHE92967.1 hypothetical protein SAMN05444278_10913 [Psychroflexus salarius]